VNRPLTRRSFLLGAAGAAGVIGAAACAKSTGVIKVPSAGASQLNLLVSSGAGDGPEDQAVSVFEAGIDQRVAFILAGKSGSLSPTPGSVVLQFSADDKNWGAAVPVDVHADTGASATAYATTTYQFPKAGTYWLRATFQGQTAESPIVVIERSAAKVPYAGQMMISTPTPTEGDHRGVNPICTRATDCGLHGQSLDVALAQNMPVALLFATPALCTSATCGPVLDNLLAGAAPYAGKIIFIHCEIFTALSRDSANAPAVLAYHLQSEPVLFLADSKRTVVQRIDGLFGKSEVASALSRLAAL
jgi:hypothetical protein